MCGEERFDERDLVRGVEADGFVVGELDVDAGAVFEGAELFEAFGFLEGRGGKGDEVEEEIGAVSVEAEVAVGGEAGVWGATKGDGGAGEVEGVGLVIEDNLDDVRVGDESRVGDGAGGGDHCKVGLVTEGLSELIDEGGIEEGFIALNIDDVGGLGAMGGGFGDAIGAGGVIRLCEYEGCLYFFAEGSDAFVISGDDEFIELLALGGAFVDVLEEGLSEEGVERLSGEAGGGPASGDDAYDFCLGVGNDNPP